MQRLIIRLGSHTNDPIHWLVHNDQEREIIASGVIHNADDLASLHEHAIHSKVIALAPSSDIYFTQVELPKNASRKALAAIPYMIEDELCGDIDKLFFALGPKLGNIQDVCVVNKKKLRQWQEAFKHADLFCAEFYPDAYCLPNNQGIGILEINAELLVKLHDGRCLQGESQWLLPITLEIANKDDVEITCFSEINDWPSTQAAKFDFDQLPMQLLLQGALEAKLNLFQGEFAVKRHTNVIWDKWKLAAALAVIAICANLVFKTTHLNNLKSDRANIRQQIQLSIRQGFPDLTRVTNPKIVLSREMAKLEQGGGGLSMLAMLARLGDAFQSSGVKPQTLKYDSKRSEIRMQSVARNFEALESFKREAQSLGFEVDQGAINNRGNEVVGVITVRG